MSGMICVLLLYFIIHILGEKNWGKEKVDNLLNFAQLSENTNLLCAR